jgi:hypothetical protein
LAGVTVQILPVTKSKKALIGAIFFFFAWTSCEKWWSSTAEFRREKE